MDVVEADGFYKGGVQTRTNQEVKHSHTCPFSINPAVDVAAFYFKSIFYFKHRGKPLRLQAATAELEVPGTGSICSY